MKYHQLKNKLPAKIISDVKRKIGTPLVCINESKELMRTLNVERKCQKLPPVGASNQSDHKPSDPEVR
jgi:hypothetical protein